MLVRWCMMMFLLRSVGLLFLLHHSPIIHGISLSEQYATARQVRCLQGHEAARPLYQTLLEGNPSDGTTATRLAASPYAVSRLENIGHPRMMDGIPTIIRELLQKANYTSASVGALLLVDDDERRMCTKCPVYVNPAAAGGAHVGTNDTFLMTPLQVVVSLFLLGLAVPVSSVPNGWFHTGLVFPCDFDSSLAIAYVSIYPFDVAPGNTLYFMTDWHPKVLSTTRIHAEEEPVMYIGPDSLALAHHFILGLQREKKKKHPQWLDLCTGSGIQAIVASSMGLCHHVVCVDVNPRALRFARFNAALNQIIEESQISFVVGDLLLETMHDMKLGRFQVITANPPFLPVPPTVHANRHSLFSSGGPSGDAVLVAVLRLAQHVLEENGTVAVVSEFCLGRRRENDHSSSSPWHAWLLGKGLLLTNQCPLSAAEYAKRRADSEHEYHLWKSHLAEQEIDAISPGLLYMQKTSAMSLEHLKVPKSSQGSIWTPWNTLAVHFTRTVSNDYFGNEMFQQ